MLTAATLNDRGAKKLSGHLGSVITLADTCAGYCAANLPEGGTDFTRWAKTS